MCCIPPLIMTDVSILLFFVSFFVLPLVSSVVRSFYILRLMNSVDVCCLVQTFSHSPWMLLGLSCVCFFSSHFVCSWQITESFREKILEWILRCTNHINKSRKLKWADTTSIKWLECLEVLLFGIELVKTCVLVVIFISSPSSSSLFYYCECQRVARSFLVWTHNKWLLTAANNLPWTFGNKIMLWWSIFKIKSVDRVSFEIHIRFWIIFSSHTHCLLSKSSH